MPNSGLDGELFLYPHHFFLTPLKFFSKVQAGPSIIIFQTSCQLWKTTEISMNKAFQLFVQRRKGDREKHMMRPDDDESELFVSKKIEKKIKGIKKNYEK